MRILMVRLGAMGDVIHTLPAAAGLKNAFPDAHLAWLVETRWQPLLDGNPFLDEVIPLDRRTLGGLAAAWRRLRAAGWDVAVDFQGLIKSALAAAAARPRRVYGFHPSAAREPLAALLYSHRVMPRTVHIVDRYLDLAAEAGALRAEPVFPIPPGVPEGALPPGPFVLACPLAGWRHKQWPLEYYSRLAALLGRHGLPLVVSGPPEAEASLRRIRGAWVHLSGIPGLIDATRRARAVVGIDSGPLHLAAALSKPGVAIYGPTDPARNGPYAGPIRVLRAPAAATTYKRHTQVSSSMLAVSPDQVWDALRGL